MTNQTTLQTTPQVTYIQLDGPKPEYQRLNDVLASNGQSILNAEKLQEFPEGFLTALGQYWGCFDPVENDFINSEYQTRDYNLLVALWDIGAYLTTNEQACLVEGRKPKKKLEVKSLIEKLDSAIGINPGNATSLDPLIENAGLLRKVFMAYSRAVNSSIEKTSSSEYQGNHWQGLEDCILDPNPSTDSPYLNL